jgi:hypothetical protein
MAKKTTRAAAKTTRAATAHGAWRRINRVQLAALLGVHADTITDYTRTGMPVLMAGGRGREGAYDAVDCLAWWRERQGKNAKEAAQTRAFDASAQLNELKLARERGELWPRDVIVQEGQAFTKGWTAQVRALPRRARHSGVITTGEQEAALAALCRQILQEIASWKTAADPLRVTDAA